MDATQQSVLYALNEAIRKAADNQAFDEIKTLTDAIEQLISGLPIADYPKEKS